MKGKDRYTITEWVRICPKCNKNVYHKNQNSLNVGSYYNKPCWECKQINHSLKLTGKPRPIFSEEWRQNIATAHKNSKVWHDSMHTDEYKKIHKENKLGDKNYWYGKHHSSETVKKMKERIVSAETKEKLKNRVITKEWRENLIKGINKPERLKLMRQYRLQQIKDSGKIPSFNRNACKFFDVLNKKLNWNGQYALKDGEKEMDGYSLDYYNPDLNLIIEWDEEYHYKAKGGNLLKKDIERQSNLLKNNCEFYRIREKTKQVYKTDQSSKDYTLQIQNLLNEYYNNKENINYGI